LAGDGGRRVYVHGGAVTRSWADSSVSLNDFIFATVRRALADARVAIRDVDGVVLAAHDLTDGRSLSSMVTAPAAGAYLKDEVRLGEDGASALVVGTARVRAGASRRTIVAAWGRASEGDPDAIANALFEPFFTRPLGLTEIAVSALRAGAALARYPGYSAWRERAARHRTAGHAPAGRRAARAVPLHAAEMPVWSDVAAALVLSAEPGPVEIRGVGMSTEPYQIGDRDLLGLPALRAAAGQALAAAGLGPGDIDVFELDGLTLFDEALALEAAGAAPAGGGMEAIAQRPDSNVDGGFAAGYCAPAMGLVRVCEAARRLRTAGTAALASGSSVVAAQSQAAIVLARP
jgi:acetyl-CoA C-acetyltransferase